MNKKETNKILRQIEDSESAMEELHGRIKERYLKTNYPTRPELLEMQTELALLLQETEKFITLKNVVMSTKE